jgi:hypothetical protein
VRFTKTIMAKEIVSGTIPTSSARFHFALFGEGAPTVISLAITKPIRPRITNSPNAPAIWTVLAVTTIVVVTVDDISHRPLE